MSWIPPENKKSCQNNQVTIFLQRIKSNNSCSSASLGIVHNIQFKIEAGAPSSFVVNIYFLLRIYNIHSEQLSFSYNNSVIEYMGLGVT